MEKKTKEIVKDKSGVGESKILETKESKILETKESKILETKESKTLEMKVSSENYDKS